MVASKIVTIDAPGRDQGKAFRLALMPPKKLKRWLAAFTVALQRERLSFVGREFAEAAQHIVEARGAMPAAAVDFDSLMDEMMGCIRLIPDPARPGNSRRLGEHDIEELRTVMLLRVEWIRLMGSVVPA